MCIKILNYKEIKEIKICIQNVFVKKQSILQGVEKTT